MVEVDCSDNRGTAEYPFGFVYFTDGRRVAYTGEHGVVKDATGGWDPITNEHVTKAEWHLRENGVNLPA